MLFGPHNVFVNLEVSKLALPSIKEVEAGLDVDELVEMLQVIRLGDFYVGELTRTTQEHVGGVTAHRARLVRPPNGVLLKVIMLCDNKKTTKKVKQFKIRKKKRRKSLNKTLETDGDGYQKNSRSK